MSDLMLWPVFTYEYLFCSREHLKKTFEKTESGHYIWHIPSEIFILKNNKSLKKDIFKF